MEVKHKKINDFQSYDAEISDAPRGKKSVSIRYFFTGEQYENIWNMLKNNGFKPCHMMLFAGSRFIGGNLVIAGMFAHKYIVDKLLFLLNKYMKNIKITASAQWVKLPRYGELDTLKIFINGNEIDGFSNNEEDFFSDM